MKTSELEIGDWVLVNGEPTQVMEILNSGINPTYYGMSDEIETYTPIDEVQPIPLTYEILESNFGPDEHKLNIDPQYLSYPKHEMIGAQLKPQPDCRKKLEVFNYDNRRGIKFECDWPDDVARPFYVHELQHMLRLCEIKDEIIF